MLRLKVCQHCFRAGFLLRRSTAEEAHANISRDNSCPNTFVLEFGRSQQYATPPVDVPKSLHTSLCRQISAPTCDINVYSTIFTFEFSRSFSRKHLLNNAAIFYFFLDQHLYIWMCVTKVYETKLSNLFALNTWLCTLAQLFILRFECFYNGEMFSINDRVLWP